MFHTFTICCIMSYSPILSHSNTSKELKQELTKEKVSEKGTLVASNHMKDVSYHMQMTPPL